MARREAEPGFIPLNSQSVPQALATGQLVTGVQRHQNPQPWDAALEVGGTQRQALPFHHALLSRAAGPSLQGSICLTQQIKMQHCFRAESGQTTHRHLSRGKSRSTTLVCRPGHGQEHRAELCSVQVTFLV